MTLGRKIFFIVLLEFLAKAKGKKPNTPQFFGYSSLLWLELCEHFISLTPQLAAFMGQEEQAAGR